jgi:hypothetical protein
MSGPASQEKSHPANPPRDDRAFNAVLCIAIAVLLGAGMYSSRGTPGEANEDEHEHAVAEPPHAAPRDEHAHSATPATHGAPQGSAAQPTPEEKAEEHPPQAPADPLERHH